MRVVRAEVLLLGLLGLLLERRRGVRLPELLLLLLVRVGELHRLRVRKGVLRVE